MNSKQLFAFIKSQLPMLPHIHAELDAVQKELDGCRNAPKIAPPQEAPVDVVKLVVPIPSKA